MEMLIIEKQALDGLSERIAALKNRLDGLYAQSGAAPAVWLNNQQACQLLCAGKRTLQNLRDAGVLPFTQIGAKVYYRHEDVGMLFQAGYIRKQAGKDQLSRQKQ